MCVLGVGMCRLICGTVTAFCFPELCLNCWWPPGNQRGGGHENPRAVGRSDPWKSPAFSMKSTLWAPAARSIPEPLKCLAETSLYHTPYDKADGKTEVGMK